MDIAGYKIEKLLGKGGMAAVYLATQQSLQRPVALKVLNPLFSDAPTFSERFLNEGRIVAALSHPNIVTIYDIGIHQDFHFISMEYVDGGDLRDRIARGMSVEQALAVAEQVARCLALAHDKGIIHRDVKPANILFRTDDSPVLTDFGIAKTLSAASELTVTGTVLGSPHYLSPEQAEGRPVDGRSDIYSLGIVIYEMLTGSKPFQGNSDISTIFKHLQESVPPLPAALTRCQGVIDAMLAKDPAMRYPDMVAVVGALGALRRATWATIGSGPLAGESAAVMLDIGEASATGPGPQRDTAKPAHHQAARRISDDLTRLLRQPAVRKLGLAVTAAAVVIGGLWLREPERSAPAPKARPPLEPAAAQPASTPGPAPRVETSDEPTPTATSASEPNAVTVAPPAGAAESSAPAPPAPEASAVDPESQASHRTVAASGGESAAEPPAQTATAHSAAAPASASPESLLAAGDAALADYRLTTPDEDNAYDYYRRALAMDPAQPQALAGLDRIADAYAELAEQQLAGGNRVQAQEYISRGLAVRPHHPRLLALQDRPARRYAGHQPSALLDTVTNAIKRVGDDAKELFTGRPKQKKGGGVDKLMGE